MSNFTIGQKVLCVDGNPPQLGCGNGDEILPTEGSIYTVRGFDGGVLLEEIVNHPQQYSEGLKEISFRPQRFRPFVSKPVEAGKKQPVLVE